MITGTIVNYYIHCKRQCWLFANKINLEDNSEDVRIGKMFHEIAHKDGKNTEVSIDNIKLDKITSEYLVEIKKSDSDIQAALYQLKFYLKKLEDKGIQKKGRLECIEKNKQDRKTHLIEYDEKVREEIINLENEINLFIAEKCPPTAVISNKCKKCAYYEYCFV